MSEVKKPSMAERLAALKAKREEAREENRKQVVEEDRVSKLPKGYEKRKANAEWELEDQAKREAAEAEGKDYARVKAMQMSVDQAERHVKKRTHKNVDETIDRTAYSYTALKQYENMTKKIKPNMGQYSASMQGDQDHSADSLRLGTHRPSAAAIDDMVEDLEKAIKRKEKLKDRRRRGDVVFEESDVNFINDKNMKYNRSLEKFYGSYSREIKDNLERGTAL